MNTHDPRWWADSKYHRGLAAEVEAREPPRPTHPSGTPRHPRTQAKVRRCVDHNHVRRATDLTRWIDAADRRDRSPRPVMGYYDEYRRAFAAADE